jgi:hypothetical protein
MTPGSPGSRAITATGKTAMKKFRNRTISGVMATPLLMSKAVAARKTSTSARSWDIW